MLDHCRACCFTSIKTSSQLEAVCDGQRAARTGRKTRWKQGWHSGKASPRSGPQRRDGVSNIESRARVSRKTWRSRLFPILKSGECTHACPGHVSPASVVYSTLNSLSSAECPAPLTTPDGAEEIQIKLVRDSVLRAINHPCCRSLQVSFLSCAGKSTPQETPESRPASRTWCSNRILV